MQRTVAIVGGGISGLALAEAIERKSAAAGQPVRARVLEADDAPGGKVRSRREDGFVVDTGPHGFLDKEPLIFSLIERLGLNEALVRANEAAARRFVVREGALRELPSSPPKFLGSDILPLSGKLRVLLEPFAAGPPGHEESVWQFAARRIGRQAADVLVDAMVTGIYGGDPKRLSLPAAFPRMFELESQYGGLFKAQLALARARRRALPSGTTPAGTTPAGAPTGVLHSFSEGLGALTGALARRSEVLVGARVERLEARGGGFVLHGAAGELQADAVALTTPAFELARLVGPHAPQPAELLAEIRYASVAVVVQAFRSEAVRRDVDGFGFLIPDRERREILGSIWASTVFPVHAPEGTVMFRTILGGARRPEHAEGDDATLAARARAELTRQLDLDPAARPLLERVIRWPAGIPQYELGHAGRVAAADAVEGAMPGVFLGGNGLRGVALLSCVADAERMAERVLRRVLGAPALPS
jgi:oxygen-dependent protoporphyrinogen oxidase